MCLFQNLLLHSFLLCHSILALLIFYLFRVNNKSLSSSLVKDFDCFWSFLKFRLSCYKVRELHFWRLSPVNQSNFLSRTHSLSLCWLPKNSLVESVCQFVFVIFPGFSVEIVHRLLFLLRFFFLPNQLTPMRIKLHLLVYRIVQNYCIVLT